MHGPMNVKYAKFPFACVCVCVNRVVGVNSGHLEHIIDIKSQPVVGKMNTTLQLLVS